MECYNRAPGWLLLNFGLLWKSVTSVQPLPWSFHSFVTVGPGGNETRVERVTCERRRRFQERLKSKVAFMITLRWALHRRCTSKLTGLSSHACTHNHQKHISAMSDACTCVEHSHESWNKWTHTYRNTQSYTHIPHSEERESRGCVSAGEAPEKCGAETLPVFPPIFAHRIPKHHNHLVFLLHTHHHSHAAFPTPWKALTSAPVCRDHSHEQRKGGETRDGERGITSKDLSLLLLSTLWFFSRTVRAHEPHLCTHIQMLHYRD